MPSLARLGVGEDQRPRLEGLGWIEDGEVIEPAHQLLLTLRSGPDPAVHVIAEPVSTCVHEIFEFTPTHFPRFVTKL